MFYLPQTAINFSLLLLPEDIEVSALSRETICPARQIFRILYFSSSTSLALYAIHWSGPSPPLFPRKFLPSRPKMRKKIVTVILTKLHEKCLPCTAHAGRMVFIGGSNLGKTATMHLCTPSSVPTSKPGKIDAVIEKVAQLKLTSSSLTSWPTVLI
jgi:hypothetical protein